MNDIAQIILAIGCVVAVIVGVTGIVVSMFRAPRG